MKTFDYVITDEIGMHARPAGLLVKAARDMESKITVSCNGRKADATKLIMLMSLGIKKGDKVSISAEGTDEDKAISRMKEFFNENL